MQNRPEVRSEGPGGASSILLRGREGPPRELAAISTADIVGFSRVLSGAVRGSYRALLRASKRRSPAANRSGRSRLQRA